MPGFTNVAVWGYNQILCARTQEKAIEYATASFPGIPEEQVIKLYNHELVPTFDDSGNTMYL